MQTQNTLPTHITKRDLGAHITAGEHGHGSWWLVSHPRKQQSNSATRGLIKKFKKKIKNTLVVTMFNKHMYASHMKS